MSASLFTRITELVPSIEGWCTVEKATALASVIVAIRAQVVVEIGIHGGRSFIPMAMAMKELKCGLVYGIDPWSPAASAQGEVTANVAFWGNLNYEQVYAGFQRLITALGLADVIRIQRIMSDYALIPELPIDLLHIDGNHTEQAMKDALRWGPRVRPGGFCFADDIEWEGGGVKKAVHALQSMGFKKLYNLDTGAMFQR